MTLTAISKRFRSGVVTARLSQRDYHSTIVTAGLSQRGCHSTVVTARLSQHGCHSTVVTAMSIAVIPAVYTVFFAVFFADDRRVAWVKASNAVDSTTGAGAGAVMRRKGSGSRATWAWVRWAMVAKGSGP